MKRSWKWGIAVVVVLGLAAGVGRAMLARKADANAAAAAPRDAAALELAPGDVAVAQPREIVRALDVTGALKAVNSAVVKAKVAAELQSLTVREGDRVTAGQVLGRLDASEYSLRVAQAQQQAASAKAQLDIADKALENNKALVNQGFISQNALDTSVSNAAGARAAMLAANAAADLARKSQNDTVLRAPIDGYVSQRLVQPGERVPIDARLVEIVDLSRLEIEAALAPEDVGAVRIGAKATLQVDGVATPVEARVARINPAAQAGTRAVLVYLGVTPQPGLRQGLFAKGRIELDHKTALAVPAAAVRIDQAKPYVLAIEDGKAVQRTIAIGVRGDAAGGAGATPEAVVEVTSGLAAGAELLRSTVGSVRDGTPVKRSPVAAVTPGAVSAAAASAAR